MSKIYFYNGAHNGDVHYSREFVRDIENKIGDEYCYIHVCDDSILKDFEIEQAHSNLPNNNLSCFADGNDIYINTWIGQQNMKYYNMYQCSLKSNYCMYSDIYNYLGIKLETISYYIPKINFDKIYKTNIDNFFERNKKYVLICNNNVLSGQAINFDFDPIIKKISDQFKDVIFVITNNTNVKGTNIFNANDIIVSDKNLLEISYLSTKCDIIVGRASGPFCFTHIQDNILNVNKLFLVFSIFENDGKWISDSESLATQIWSNNFDENNIIENIIKYL